MNIQENQSINSSIDETCLTMYLHGENQSCDICGKQPSLCYTVDVSYLKIKEQLKCRHCGFVNEPEKFTLQ